ncbi:hypothetical protein BKA64DRAFT_573463 [Cadophora sp. MPI-SDFR-AT-0126]|nr:hypothetical protein BKA64DRAFT_573463 [Leotiomycetes sp. MPI-SDFR-AT-0126]
MYHSQSSPDTDSAGTFPDPAPRGALPSPHAGRSARAADGARKRARRDSEERLPPKSNAPRARVRAPVACTACRGRKTKCDGLRPTCGYCEKTNAKCTYDTYDNAASHPASPRSAAVVEDQPADPFISTFHTSNGVGLDSILKWSIFPEETQTLPVDDGKPVPMHDALPSVALPHLRALEGNYILVVHSKNPMLDLVSLRKHISLVAENGFDWSIRAGLVSAVCAIGALCQTHDSTSPTFEEELRNDVDIAYQFWSVASKRLGMAMSHNTIESAQFFCLAGIWFMCNLQPLEAWKHFTMAGNVCLYSLTHNRASTSNFDIQPQRQMLQTLEQSTFYTVYKSELEVRYELAIHGSVLEHIEDHIVFPAPPHSNDADNGGDIPHEDTVSWYFYLSDIAARHLINRIIESRTRSILRCDKSGIESLLQDYKIFMSQLQEWYESLPLAVSFELPRTTIAFDPDMSKRILRARYMFIHELLCRPFVQICVSRRLDLPEALLDEVVSKASLGLRYCALSLQGLPTHVRFDHGLWVSLRNSVACAMILIGAARGSRMPSLNAADRLQLPEDWREIIMDGMNKFAMFATESKGGIVNAIELVYEALADFPTFTSEE